MIYIISNIVNAGVVNPTTIVYCIDLDEKNPEVMEYSGDELREDMETFGTTDPLDLSDYDRKVFRTEAEAEFYLEKFMLMKSMLHNHVEPHPDSVTSILYKRHYLIQTLMGEKNQTFRDSFRTIRVMSKVNPGDIFTLTDQTYRVAVRLTEKIGHGGEMEYRFQLVK